MLSASVAPCDTLFNYFNTLIPHPISWAQPMGSGVDPAAGWRLCVSTGSAQQPMHVHARVPCCAAGATTSPACWTCCLRARDSGWQSKMTGPPPFPFLLPLFPRSPPGAGAGAGAPMLVVGTPSPVRSPTVNPCVFRLLAPTCRFPGDQIV